MTQQTFLCHANKMPLTPFQQKLSERETEEGTARQNEARQQQASHGKARRGKVRYCRQGIRTAR